MCVCTWGDPSQAFFLSYPSTLVSEIGSHSLKLINSSGLVGERAQRSSWTLEFQVCDTVLVSLCSSEFWELNSSLHGKYPINWTVSSASGSTIWMEIQKARFHWQMKQETIFSASTWSIMKPVQWRHCGFQYSEREEGDNTALGGWHLAQEQWLWGKVALGPAAIYLGEKNETWFPTPSYSKY